MPATSSFLIKPIFRTLREFTPESIWHLSHAQFTVESCRLGKGNSDFSRVKAKPWDWPFVLWNKAWNRLINVNPARIGHYERLLARFSAFQEIKVVLRTVKADPLSVERLSPAACADEHG